jgi:aspartyl-tRNA(Asn)/glutamyl-tRNA(Gln) amidotransferase subunit A
VELERAKTIRELSSSIKKGELSPVQVTERLLDRIERLNHVLNCYITVLKDTAIAEAEKAEHEIKEGGYRGPLHGIPIAIKDLIYIKGVRCTAGSKILRDNVAQYDAAVVRRLRSAGAVLIGTTNMHEFASGVTSVNPFFGPSKNPWDVQRITGGSSGGSAAAVAAGLAPGALGTDTGGSVRIPAALCGVVGLKPTYGRISRTGVIPLATSLDTVGTLTSSAWDAALLLRLLAGRDANDLTAEGVTVPDFVAEVEKPEVRLKIGVPRRYFFDIIDPGVESEFSKFQDRLSQMGAEVSDLELEGIYRAGASWEAILRAEEFAFHEPWFDKTPEDYGDDVRHAIERGKQISASQYIGARDSRLSITEGFLGSMLDFDIVAVPTIPTIAPRIGERTINIRGDSVEVSSTLRRLTFPFNLVGFPVLSIPTGLSRDLPVGVQLVGRPFEEASLLRLAFNYQSRFGLFPAPSVATHPSN